MQREKLYKLLTQTVRLAEISPAGWAAAVGVLITCICFTLLLVLVRQSYTYGTNDDLAIVQMIQAGYLVPYVDSTYSSLLHFLYVEVSDSVPWYGIWLLMVLGVSTATLMGVSIHYGRGYFRILLPLVVIALYCAFVVNLDYSAVGIMGGFAALTTTAVLVLKEALTVRRAFFLGMLAMAATWVRLESVEAVAVFSVPIGIVVMLYWFGDERLRRTVRYLPILVALVPLAISITADNIHKSRFSSPQYREYAQWNSLRGKFHTNPVAAANRSNPQVLAATRWSKEDYSSLMKWFFVDESLYNKKSMQAFFDVANSPDITSYGARYFLWRFTHLLLVYWFYWLMLFALVVLIVIGGHMGGLERLTFVFAPICVFAFIYFMDALFRYPSRVAVPSICGFTIAYASVGMAKPGRMRTLKQLMGTTSPTLGAKSRKLLPYSLGADISEAFLRGVAVVGSLFVVVACSLYVVNNAYAEQIVLQKTVLRYNEITTYLNRKYAGRYILIQPGSGLWTRFQSPFSQFVTEFHPIDVGWETFSPLFYAQIQGLGVTRGQDLPRTLVNNGNAFILAHEQWADLVVDYLHRHASMPAAHKEIVEKIDQNLYMYRLVNP